MRYTLRQLEVFLATAHYQNVTRAANSLAMSQSAASGALRELEQQFGVQLFDRVGKRLRTNELGQSLRPRAEALLEQAQEFEQTIADGSAPGHLKLGATLSIGNYLAVGMIAAFKQQFPEAEIELNVANTETIARQVANYELDTGLIEGELRHPDLEVLPWRADKLVAFAAPGHPLASSSALSDEQLLSLPWVVREQGSGTRQTFDRAMHGLLSDLDISLELQHTEAIKRAVEAGLGVGCLSIICMQEAFARGSLVPLNIPHRDFSRRFSIILHRQKYRGSGLQQWLALCQDW
ncbi:MAG: LysR family transcriptional regulator [Gammaproteobacteria bacterium]|nr:LysR family transcriptional regulator [Gammaproteobacteria bacterium]